MVTVASGHRDIMEEGTLMQRKDSRIGSRHFALWTNFVWHFHTNKEKGQSINYVSMFEGGGGHKMLTDAYVGEGGISKMLT